MGVSVDDAGHEVILDVAVAADDGPEAGIVGDGGPGDAQGMQFAVSGVDELGGLAQTLVERERLYEGTVRRRQIQHPAQHGVGAGDADASVREKPPVEEIDVVEPRRRRVGPHVVARAQVQLDRGQGAACDGRLRAPHAGLDAEEQRRREQAQQTDVHEMRREDGRERVVEVRLWFVRVAEDAVDDGVRAEGEVLQAEIEGRELGPEDLVARRQRLSGGGREPSEEDIGGYLQARTGRLEHIERLQRHERREQREEGRGEEDVQRMSHAARHRPNMDVLGPRRRRRR